MTISSSTFRSSHERELAFTLFTGTNDSPAIVFVHGLGSSQNYFYSIAKGLYKKGFTCLVFDTYGSALSPFKKQHDVTEDLENAGFDIMGLIIHCGLGKIVLVGHSMGGMIVNYLSSKFTTCPVDVVKTILLAPVHPSRSLIDVFGSRIQTLQSTPDLRPIASTVAENALGSVATDLQRSFVRELVSRQTVEGYIYNCSLIVGTSERQSKCDLFEEIYATITCPVLILCGDEDTNTPWDGCVNQIYTSLRNTTVEVKRLPYVGHWIAVEADQLVLSAILEFCS